MPVTILVLCLIRYCLPGTMGVSAIQTTIVSRRCSNLGTLPVRTIISPRLTSISSSSVKRHSQRRVGLLQFAVESHDLLDPAGLARRQRHDLFTALTNDARGDRAAESAIVQIAAD